MPPRSLSQLVSNPASLLLLPASSQVLQPSLTCLLFQNLYPADTQAYFEVRDVLLGLKPLSASYDYFGPGKLSFKVVSTFTYEDARQGLLLSFDIPDPLTFESFFTSQQYSVFAATSNHQICPVGPIL